MQSKTRTRIGTGLAGLALSIALIATPAIAGKVQRGVSSGHQPVVARTDFVFDVSGGAEGALSPAEQGRLAAWFDALGLRYGDHVMIAGGSAGTAGLRDGVDAVVARYGLLPEGEAPVTVGAPAAGSLRVVVSRSTASVPGCPDWRDKSQSDLVGGLANNFGCAMAGNLAAMVADPQDLVQGRSTDTDLRAATSSRAIKSYQAKEPTGSGGLQTMSAGGN